MHAQGTTARWIDEADGDLRHLRSAREVVGYTVQATDRHVGLVEDVVLENDPWRIPFLTVATLAVLSGNVLLVESDRVSSIELARRRLCLSLSASQIEERAVRSVTGSEVEDPRIRLEP